MQKLIKRSVLWSVLPWVAMATQADQIIINGDGREILLKDDGSWQYASDDIYVDTKDGQRVVLTPDGRWQPVGLAPVVEEDKYRELLVEVVISNAVIDEVREKVGSQKNTRTRSVTHFELSVSVAKSAKQPLKIADLKPALFKVKDSRNKNYKVEAVDAEQDQIAPGQQGVVKLTVKGAPGGLVRARSMSVDIDQKAFNTEDVIHLEIDYDLIKRKRVNL